VGVAFQWNSLLVCIISNKPTTTTEEFDAFHGFQPKKISKIRQILRMKKIRKIQILDLCLQQPFRLSETATLS